MRLDSPVRIGVAAGTAAGIFALLRFVVACHSNIANFVVAGALQVHPNPVTHGLPIGSGAGYDGQFYFRLALDPLNWSRTAFGIRLDSYARLQRIVYPVLAWLVAAGRASGVTVSLVVVNVLALGTLAGLCAALVLEAGRHVLWGLMIPAYWGFLWSLSRDLTEIVAACFMIASLYALRRRRPVLAGLALSVAVLSRETVLGIVVALVLARAFAIVKGLRDKPSGDFREKGLNITSARLRPVLADVAWALPAVCFAGWQIAVHAVTGTYPVHASGQANVGIPFLGMWRGIEYYVPRLPSTASLLWFGEFTVLAGIGILAATCLRRSTALLHERVAWVVYALLTVSLASGIWRGDVGFRSLDELFVFSCLVLLSSKVRLRLPALAIAAAWVVVCIELIVFI
jgi:hypothetical protein